MFGTRAIRILIADDQGIWREALRSFLQKQPEFEFVGESTTTKELFENSKACNPDIVILEIALPDLNVIEWGDLLRKQNPSLHILVLTSYDDNEHLKECLLAGANAYILKKSGLEDLRLGLLTAHRGGTYIDAAIANRLRPILSKGDESGTAESELSERETEVLTLISQGFSIKDLSLRLKISMKTIETHKLRSMKKLNLHSRAEIVKYALERGWLKKGDRS